MTPRICLCSILSAALPLVAGCGKNAAIQGNWKVQEVRPIEAQLHYNLTQLRLNEDSTFVALTRQDDRISETRGTYSYDSWTGNLKLRFGAKEIPYSTLVLLRRELIMKHRLEDGRKLTAVLVRDKSCIRCATCPLCSKKPE